MCRRNFLMITTNPQLLAGYELLNRDKINNSLINSIQNSLMDYRQEQITSIGYVSNTQKMLLTGFHDNTKISYVSDPQDTFYHLYYINLNNQTINGITFSNVNIIQSQEYLYNSTYDQYYDIYVVKDNKIYFNQPYDDDDTINAIINSTYNSLIYFNKNVLDSMSIIQSKVNTSNPIPQPPQLIFGQFDNNKNLKIYKVNIPNFLKYINPSTINQLDIVDIVFNQRNVPSLPDVNNYIRIIHTVTQSSFNTNTLSVTLPQVDGINQNIKIVFTANSGNISNYIQQYDVFLFGIQMPNSIYFYSENEFKIHADNGINITIDANNTSSNAVFAIAHDGAHAPDNYSEGTNGQTNLVTISETGEQTYNIKRNYNKITDNGNILFEINNTVNSDRDGTNNNATSGVNTRFTYNGFAIITGHDKTADQIGLEVIYNIKGNNGIFNNVTITNDLTVNGITHLADQSSENIANYLVRRDSNGNFQAGTITAQLNGNQATASKLKTARTISIAGSVTGSQLFDGSQNITINTTTNHTHPSSDITDQTPNNTPNTIVKRDSNGSFKQQNLELAGNLQVQGNLTVSGTTTTINTETIELQDNIILLNSNYTGSSPSENAGIEINRGTLQHPKLLWDETNDTWAVSIDGTTLYEILNQNNYTNYTVTKTGGGASGIWNISITGNQATASKLSTARTISLAGSVTGSQSFDGSQNITINTTTNHTHPSSDITDQTPNNTPNTIVKRDSNGSFKQQNIDIISLSNNGTAIINNQRVYNAVWNDLQEQFEVDNIYINDTDILKSWVNYPVVMINNRVSILKTYNDIDKVIGIVTSEFGLVLNQTEDELWHTKIPVSLQGTLTIDKSMFVNIPQCYEYVIIDKETLKYRSINKCDQNWYDIIAKIIDVNENTVKILIK